MEGVNEMHNLCSFILISPTKIKTNRIHVSNHKSNQRDNYLGDADDEITELGMQASLLLKPTGNGFAKCFQCKCP